MRRGSLISCKPIVFHTECIVVCVGRCWPFDVMICCGFDFVFELFYFCGGLLSFKQRGVSFCCRSIVFQLEGIVVCVHVDRC